VATYEHFVIAV